MANTQDDSTGKYAFLRALDIEWLEKLLKADFRDSMSEEASEEFMDAIVEVMLEKEKEDPSGRTSDLERAWSDFQTYYNVPEREGQLLYPDLASPESTPFKKAPTHRPKRILRRILPVAATIGLFMSLLVVAQAAGFDVFGAMARWTNETFQFVTASANDETAAFRSLLEEQDIPASYAPTWIPAGLKAEEPQVSIAKSSVTVSVYFSNEQDYVLVTVTHNASERAIRYAGYEKRIGDATPYSNGTQLFYIFENSDNTVATWSDGGAYTIDILGTISIDDMKSIINSIGG